MSLTGLVVLFVFVFLISYTALAQRNRQPTISMFMRDLAWDWNAAAHVAGLLIGHWYVSLQNPIQHAFGWTLPGLLVYLGLDLLWRFRALPYTWYRWPPIPFILGVVSGALFWGQGSPRGPI